MPTTTTKKEEAQTVAPPAPPSLVLPIEITLARFRPMQVVLVGAGGTGARLGTDIARLLSRGDKLIVIDPDRVEDRNLVRQHFIRPDIGKYKAEVIARRAQVVAGAGVIIEPRITALENMQSVLPLTDRTIGGTIPTLWVGAVDTRKCRQLSATFLNTNPRQGLWIDVGNEMRAGQVGMWGGWLASSVKDPNSGKSWPTKAQEAAIVAGMREGYGREVLNFRNGPWVHMNTIAEITPAILQPDPVEEAKTAECPIRIDTQSLAANVMAYAVTINLVSRILDGLDISMGASFFSTNNTMVGKPFQHIGGDMMGQLTLGVTRKFDSLGVLQGFVKEAMLPTALKGVEGVATR